MDERFFFSAPYIVRILKKIKKNKKSQKNTILRLYGTPPPTTFLGFHEK